MKKLELVRETGESFETRKYYEDMRGEMRSLDSKVRTLKNRANIAHKSASNLSSMVKEREDNHIDLNKQAPKVITPDPEPPVPLEEVPEVK